MTEMLQTLGKKLRSRREELGFSQEALADLCGFDRTYISLLERGKRNVSLINLARIAQGLRTSVAQLAEGIEYGSFPER